MRLYMSKRQPILLIEDIIESGERILLYTVGFTFEQFLSDSKTIDAVIRNFEIIGEASGRLPNEFKEKYPDIDWNRMRGFRNRLVHDYFGIDLNIIWQIKEATLPGLILRLKLLR